MKILLAFAPFLTFALLNKMLGAELALPAAALVSALLLLRETLVLRRQPKILDVGSLILFGSLGIASRLGAIDASVLAVRLWVDAGLLAIVVGSILVGHPFTLQYAREQVSPAMASHPRVRRTALMIAVAWAFAFAAIVATDLAMLYIPGITPAVGTVLILASLGAAAWLTSWLPKAAAKQA